MQTMRHLSRSGLRTSLFSRRTLRDSLIRLNPALLLSNPVMFIVELTFFVVAAMAVYPPAFYPVASLALRVYYVEIAFILLLTVWFATLSNALAESQAKNTANSLRSLESEVQSKKILVEGDVRRFVATPSTALRKGDLILLEKNDVVPIDAEILEGISMVDESLLTGESTPVRKAPGDEVIGGSKIISDNLTARVTVNPEETYISQMIKMVESSKRPRTPNEVAVTMVLVGLTAIFTIIVSALLGLSITLNLAIDLSVLIALYVCLLPTTIGALLPAIGLSGISRLYRRKIVAKSGRAVERAGDTDVIILDKTGTITVGNRQATEFIPFEGHTSKEVGEAAFLSSWHDDTPEGRSLIRLAYEDGFVPRELNALAVSEVYEFSASTRTSGVKNSQGSGFMLPKGDKSGRERGRLRRKFEPHQEAGSAPSEDETEIIKGAPDAVKKIVRTVPSNYDELVNQISSRGDTPLAVTKNREAIGLIRLRDVLKPDIREKIESVKVMGIRPVMLTGDQPLTAKSIANEVAKYFAIVPVMFASTLPQLKALNILGLGLSTAVLSALIFNAAIIPLLIPLAMRGIGFKPTSTMSLFIKNALIYGAGGIIVPFIGIKLIDIALLSLGV